MTHFVLFLESEQRPISNVEMIAAMQMAKVRGGPIYAEGIDGFQYQIQIDSLDNPVLFHDAQSAQNAFHYLRYDMDVDESTFRILPYEP